MKSSNDVYRQLQIHLDSMPIPFPESETGLDIKLLQHFFTPEEAKIALELSALPEPINRIHKRLKDTGISLNELESTLDKMVEKGSILGDKIFESKGKGKLYSKAPLAIGMYELQAGRLTKELETDFQGYMDDKFYKALHNKKTSQMRTIPISKGINTDRYVDSYDNVRNIVKNTDRPIAVIECVCRSGKDLLEEPCKNSDIRETCLLFEDIANAAIDSGGARPITKEETLSTLGKAEEAGFVLQPENTQKPNFICCCCGDCCNVLTTVKKFPKPAEYYHSNYYSKVASENCDQCWDCIEKCPMDALEMEDDNPIIDLDRCIGCGVCVSTCKSGAYELKTKDVKHVPPKDTDALYKKILVERIGFGGMLKTLPKMIFHQKI